MMRPRKVRVGSSPLGKAVFAQREFITHEVIGEIKGEIIDDPLFASTFGMDLGGELTLDPKPPFRFLNHSCQPNCELFMWDTDQTSPIPRLWLQAVARIQPGDELTIDYGWPAQSAIPCGCRAANCRGWVVDEAQVHLVAESTAATAAGCLTRHP